MNQIFFTLVNAGVLLSVILLIVEIRQNQGIAIAEIRNDISRQSVEREIFFSSPEISRAFVKARNGEELSDIEAFHMQRVTAVTLQIFENIVYQYEAGMYSNEEFEAVERKLKEMSPFMLDFYNARQSDFSASFQRTMTRVHDIE